ncbi:MAG: aminotransferase class I/II-fold pyridoxal phosphate-dependent enzyme [Actinobacteria bacterium]|nr:aminotransferase class I/II-fold pyridoxal phosphate-dependent enzyme [Actinomycetota bacterium]
MEPGAPGLPIDPLDALRQRRSAKWLTYPADVLPLPVAEMDVNLAPPIAEVLAEAVRRSDTGYGYTGTELARAVAKFTASRWSWDIDPAQVTAVTDVGVGVVELLRALTGPGDAVAISPPVYPPFFDWVPESGARLLEVPLAHDGGGYQLDLDALERAFATHPAAYVLCNPHNPVGRVHTPAELAALVRLARIYHVTLISDEIHGPLVLPGATFTPLLTVPGAAEVAVTVMSASKAWNLAGLKCAVVVTASPRLAAVVDRFPPDTPWRFGLDCSAVCPDSTARELFLDRGRVALEPGLRYGAQGAGYARLNFATSAGILDQAVDRMAAALQ